MAGWIRLAQRVVRKLRSATGPRPAWERRVIADDRAFDAAHGIETGGIVELKHLSIAGDAKDLGHRHIAIGAPEFESAIARLRIEHAKFTFVDLGSGKGRALYLALRHPFRSIVGVEFARELDAVARVNFADNPRVRLECGNAAEFEFPDGPLVVYLYNPFGLEIMRRVAARIGKAYEREPRPIFVIYMNPFEAGAWSEHGFVAHEEGRGFTIYCPALPIPDATEASRDGSI